MDYSTWPLIELRRERDKIEEAILGKLIAETNSRLALARFPPGVDNALLDTPIAVCTELSARTISALHADGLTTLRDVYERREQLLVIPNLGRKSCAEIKSVFDRLGLKR